MSIQQIIYWKFINS